MKKTSGNITLSSTKTTTSNSFVDVPEASFTFVAAHENCRLAWFNVAVSNTNAAQSGAIRAAIATLTHLTEAQGQQVGTTIRELRCSAVFENLTVGNTYTAKLQFAASGATENVGSGTGLAWELEEWD